MSDQSPEVSTAPEMSATTLSAAPSANPAVANAAQVLAVKELGEAVTGIKKQVKRLWIAVAVLGVLVLVVGTVSFVPSLRFGMMGRPNFRGQFNGTNGTFQGPSGGSTNQGTSTNQ